MAEFVFVNEQFLDAKTKLLQSMFDGDEQTIAFDGTTDIGQWVLVAFCFWLMTNVDAGVFSIDEATELAKKKLEDVLDADFGDEWREDMKAGDELANEIRSQLESQN
jgi:hypothetical protein